MNDLFDRYKTTGDIAALTELLDRMKRAVMTFYLSRGWQAADIDDAFQDVSIQLVTKVDTMERKGSVKALIYSMTRYALLRVHRARTRQGWRSRTFTDLTRQDKPDHRPERFIPDRGKSEPAPPSTLLVADAVETLPAKPREVCRLMLEGLNKNQISLRIGIAPHSVDCRLRTTKAHLGRIPEIQQILGIEPEPAKYNRDRLSEAHAVIIQLIHVEGLTHREAAQRLGITPEQARGRWNKARCKVAKSKALQTLTGIMPNAPA